MTNVSLYSHFMGWRPTDVPDSQDQDALCCMLSVLLPLPQFHKGFQETAKYNNHEIVFG